MKVLLLTQKQVVYKCFLPRVLINVFSLGARGVLLYFLGAVGVASFRKRGVVSVDCTVKLCRHTTTRDRDSGRESCTSCREEVLKCDITNNISQFLYLTVTLI